MNKTADLALGALGADPGRKVRARLMAGASVPAALVTAGLALAGATGAHADTTISSPTGAPLSWTAGNYTVTSSGALGGTQPLNVTGNVGTLTNSGLITITNNWLEIYPSVTAASVVNNATIMHGGGLYVNNGTLTSFTNNGSISSYSLLFSRGGSIGAIVNTGVVTVSDPAIVLDNGSTLGSLSNSGTISGSTVLASTSTIATTITNTGMLAGAIKSAVSLSIAGGAGSVVGTLTGYGGGVGSISISSGGLILSGNQLLNDNVTASTVTADGAAISITNPITVTGAYGQSTGQLSIAGGAELVVTGAASIAHVTVAASLSSTGNYIAGQGETLIAGGAGSSYTSITLSPRLPGGLSTSASVSGSNYAIINANDYIGGTLGSLTNSGTIAQSNALYVASTGRLGAFTNTGALSTSSSAPAAVTNHGAIGALTNSGLISNGTGDGVYNAGGTITLLSNSGVISGSSAAVHNLSGGYIGTISNTGTITGARAIYAVSDIGVISNAAGGSIVSTGTGSDGETAIAIGSAASLGTLTNSGLIQAYRRGVDNEHSVTALINQAGGTIADSSNRGQDIANNGFIGTVVNNGLLTVTGAGSNTDGAGGSALVANPMGVANYGTITSLTNGGTISITGSASPTGVYNASAGSIGALTNSGNIVVSGASGAGVDNMGALGSLVNNSGATIAATGAGAFGVFNNGSISLLSNAGVISGQGVGVRDGGGGHIGTLSNTGTITGGKGVAVSSGGIITLSNAGLISGATAAISIASAGSIGTLLNSGTIAGAIINASSNDLSIAGGSGTAFATLTGYSGASATITNTLSNLVLSGNHLLDDDVNVGPFSVFSSGALQANRAVNITGNFTQTGGTLRFGVTSASNYGKLNVSGAAAVNGAQVMLIPLVSNVLATGQSYTVVSATGALTTSSITSTVTGFNSTVSGGDGHNLVVSLVAAPSAPPSTPTPPPPLYAPVGAATGGGAAGTGAAIDKIIQAGSSSSASAAFNQLVVPVLNNLSGADKGKALVQLSPSALTPQFSVNTFQPVSGAVTPHLTNFAAVVRGQQYASLGGDDYYGGVSDSGRNLWGKVLGGGASRADEANASPYTATFYGALLGADLVQTDQVMGGAAFSWINADAVGNHALAGSSTRLNSYQITAYGTAVPKAFGGRLSIDGQIAYGFNHYDQTRQIDFLGARAKAGFDGQQLLASAAVGYAFETKAGVVLTPYVGISEAHLANGGYTETGAGVADIGVRSQTSDTFSHDIGVKVSGSMDMGRGLTALPSIKLGWNHVYNNGPIPLTGTMGGVAFISSTARPIADGAAIGADVTFQNAGRWKLGVEYQGDIRRDFQSHTGAVKLTMKF